MPKKKINVAYLKQIARYQAVRYLDQENVTSVGVGYKVKDGKQTNELCIQFTVGQKIALESLDGAGLAELPRSFKVGDVEIPTDVIERSYKHSGQQIEVKRKPNRKARMDPIQPGASIGHPKISAGTVGCVVFGVHDSKEYILSNWHVLHGEQGSIGDTIVQPGAYDDNRFRRNIVGRLVRSHLGPAGDCAIAEIDQREVDPEILELKVKVSGIAEPELGDSVVKSGRTTAVTYGIVSRVHVTVKLGYGSAGVHHIGKARRAVSRKRSTRVLSTFYPPPTSHERACK